MVVGSGAGRPIVIGFEAESTVPRSGNIDSVPETRDRFRFHLVKTSYKDRISLLDSVPVTSLKFTNQNLSLKNYFQNILQNLSLELDSLTI